MKILLVSNLYPPHAVGGYERLCATIAGALARRGHQLSVLTSDHGGPVQGREEPPVERSLKLLISGGNIYQPFAGSSGERDSINQHNLSRVAQALKREKPDAVLVGNLYFFDQSILEAFQPTAERTVYLLTDVWRIHFADPQSLQDYFRDHVHKLVPGAPLLVPADPPALVLDRVGSAEEWARYQSAFSFELSRRRDVEQKLAAGRDAWQARGACYLCGPTTFLVRSAGPATLALSERAQAKTVCTTCGLDGDARGALQALDAQASPDTAAEVLLAVSDPAARQILERRYAHCTTVGSVLDLGGNAAAPGAFRHAVLLESSASLEETQLKLKLLASWVGPGGTVVLGAQFAPQQPSWPLVEMAKEAGLRDATAQVYWSRPLGYLGREHILYSAQLKH